MCKNRPKEARKGVKEAKKEFLRHPHTFCLKDKMQEADNGEKEARNGGKEAKKGF